MLQHKDHLDEPVTANMRTDFATFDENMTTDDVLKSIRESGLGESISYFYVTGPDKKLVGVVPTRRLLTSQPDVPLREIMIKRLVFVHSSATVYDACELFIMHRLLALPVVDDERRMVGMIDINLFTDEMLDVARRQEVDDVFQWVGIRLEQLQNASPLKAYRHRIPWLAATFAGGVLCSIITAFFEGTLQQAIILGVFLTVALGVGESICIQSMTITIQTLHGGRTEPARARLRRELLTALLLGLSVGAGLGLISFVYKQWAIISLSIAVSIGLATIAGSLIGSMIPHIVNRVGKDPKVASGPIALALTDACTVTLYFGLATLAI